MNEQQEQINLFDYSIVSAFNEQFYKNLLLKKHLVDEVIFITSVKTPDGKHYEEEELNAFFYVFKKDGHKYLVEKNCIDDVPIEVLDEEMVAYKGSGYKLVRNYSSHKIRPERIYSFRELIQKFAYFKHSCPKDFLLYKILCFASYFSRINFRCSSQPAFGKDSVLNLLNDISGNVSIVQKPTIAKLEYLSVNKVLVCNEMSNLTQKEQEEIEHYLLAVGAFANRYTKRSRGSKKHGSKEEYDISKLSLIILYNDIECYNSTDKYFDKIFPKQIIDRFPAFKFNGRIEENFGEIRNADDIAKSKKDDFLKIIRTIRYYQNLWRDELKPYSAIDFGLSVRYQKIFNIISMFVNIYSKNEKEYKSLMGELYNRFIGYEHMINPYSTKKIITEDGKLNFDGTVVEEEVIE